MRNAFAVAVVAGSLVVAGCRTAETARDEGPAAGTAPAGAPALETWPPPGVVAHPPKAHEPGEKTITLLPKEGGWRIDELLESVSKATGRSILYDSTNATFKQSKVEFVGQHVIPESEMFDWLQAVLAYRKLVLVPVGPRATDGGQQWYVMDQADPNLKSRPTFVAEADLADYADRDGLYIVTALRVRDTVDTAYLRNALSPLSTQIAGIGRITDVPYARTLIVGDFAPVVWAMKQSLDRINALADRPMPEPRTQPAKK